MLRAYKYSPIEEWVEIFYKKNGFLHPEDLDIEQIATTLDIQIEYTLGPDRAIWDDESAVSVIFIKETHPEYKKREIFFHELCHPLRHVGNQNEMKNSSFMLLQEIQANQFQLYSALPFFMINAQKHLITNDTVINDLATKFNVSNKLVTRRLSQIKRRILQRQLDIAIEEKPIYNTSKQISTKSVPVHARSLVNQALLSKQSTRGDRH